jgi:hypothetical protein
MLCACAVALGGCGPFLAAEAAWVPALLLEPEDEGVAYRLEACVEGRREYEWVWDAESEVSLIAPA